jgi:hypothetical protein
LPTIFASPTATFLAFYRICKEKQTSSTEQLKINSSVVFEHDQQTAVVVSKLDRKELSGEERTQHFME